MTKKIQQRKIDRMFFPRLLHGNRNYHKREAQADDSTAVILYNMSKPSRRGLPHSAFQVRRNNISRVILLSCYRLNVRQLLLTS